MKVEDIKIEEILNLERYPIDGADPGTQAEFVSACHQTYIQTGLCELPDFILAEALSHLAAEANSFSSHAYFCNSAHNAYLDDGQPGEDSDRVENRMEKTFVGSVPYDRINKQSMISQLYQWDPLKNFIAGVLGKKEFYRFSDPFGACSINVFIDNGEHGWHFDESEFTITLMLQPPETGGDFEYVAKIRGAE